MIWCFVRIPGRSISHIAAEAENREMFRWRQRSFRWSRCFFFPSPGPETISTGTNGHVSSAILLDQGEYLITY